MKRIFYVFMVLFLWLGIGANSLQAQNALNFDGADDYVDCGNSAALQLSTGTIETWVKTSGAGASYRGIVVKQLAYSLFLVDNVLTVYNWGSSVANSTAVNLADGQWHHVAMSFQSGVANGTKVYVDGVLRTTITLTNSAQTSPLTLGTGTTAAGQNMNGTMKGTRIWNTVRTATEIANYRFTETVGTETGLVAAYNFNQGTANGTNTGVTTLNDVKASNNGTLTNFALTGATSNWVTGFTFASALSFDGTNDLVNCGNAASVQRATGTIEAWIKTSGAGASFRSIVAKPLAYSLFLKDNVLIAYDWVNGEKSTGVNLADGQWHHVALSFQPSANLSKIYIDGVPRLTIATPWGVNAQTSPLLIGDGDLAGGQSFNGSIDEVRVWNTARTDAQIASNYSCQLVGDESGLAAYYKFSQGFAAGTNTGLTTLIDATANANNGTLTNFTLTGATSNWITSGASTTVTPSVSIVANVSGTISPTTSVTFTATPTNGGDSPTYQWKKNGANVGTSSATYTDATWANNDVVTCVLTSSSSCASPTTATSNAVTLSVTTTVTPSVSIAASATTVCGTGTSVTFTATPTNGGTPTYVWQKNGNTISGEVSSTYTTTDLANGDMISCVMTSSLANATPTTATSNTVTMTVNALPSVTLSNTGANSLVGTAVLSVNSTTASDIKWYNGATLANTSAVSATGTTVAGGNGQGSAANQLNEPNHIYVDGSGNIYISDFLNHRIQKWAPGATSGTTVAGGNGSGSAANQLYRPNGIYVDGSGNMYIVDNANARIQKWAAGATSGTTVAGGNGLGSAANQLYGPTDIYVDGSGNMYITDIGNDRIQKWAAGAASGTTVAGSNGAGSAANQLNAAEGIYVDATGNMYIADRNNNRIQKWAAGAATGTTVAGGNGAGSAANQLNNPTDVFVDGSGNMYIADYNNNNRIQKWAAGATSGTTVAGGNGEGSAANQLIGPSDVYVDGSGNMYIADRLNNRIQKWGPGTAVNTYTPTTAGSYTAVVTVNGCSVTTNAITVDAPVTPSVSIAASATTICSEGTSITFTATPTNGGTPTYVWKKNGNTISGEVSSTYTTTSLANGDIISCVMTSSLANASPTTATSNSITMAVITTSSITLSNTGANNDLGKAVLSVNTTTATDIKWYNGATLVNTSAYALGVGTTVAGGNGQGSAANQLYYPSNIYLDAAGNMYIADFNNHRIQKWAPGATTGTTVANQLNNPTGIYIDAVGNMYIADSKNHRIQKWAPGATSGTTVAGGNGQGAAANQLNDPKDIYVDAVGNIYIADFANHRIQKWMPEATTGTTVAGGNGQGAAANQLYYPWGVYVDATGNIYVGDYGNSRIQKWSASATTGTTVAGSNGFGSGANQLNNPTGIYIDGSGNMYIADYRNNRIQKWAPGATSGTTVAGGNGYGSGVNQLAGPTGVYIDGSGNMYIADYNNNRIQKWAPLAVVNTYTPTTTGSYTAVVTANGCSVTTNAITIVNIPSVSIAASATTICAGTSVTFTATPVKGGTTPTYVWKKNGSTISGQSNSTYTTTGLAHGDVIACEMTSNIVDATPATVTSNSVTMSVTGVNAVANQTVTAGSTTTAVTLTVTNATGFTWTNNNTAIGLAASGTSNIPAFTATNNTNAPITATITVTPVSTSPTCTGTTFTITVNPLIIPTVSIAITTGLPTGQVIPSICTGTSVTFTATPTNGGTPPQYQWKKNGNDVGMNSTTYTDAALANNDVITCVMTSTMPYVTVPTATSNSITMTVNALPTINSVSNQTLNAGSMTTAVTLTGTDATSYNWTNSNTAIGLTASGSGNIAAFTATNTTTAPITATISATATNGVDGLAYIPTWQGSLIVVNTGTNAIVRTIANVGSSMNGVAINSDGSRVYVTNQTAPGKVSVVNTTTNTVETMVTVGNYPSNLTLSPNGSFLYVLHSQTISVINTATNTVSATISAGVSPSDVVFSPDGSLAYVTNSGSNTVSVINTTTNAVVATVAVGGGPSGVGINTDGSRLYVTNRSDQTLSVINTATNAVISTLSVNGSPVLAVVSPDGTRAYSLNSVYANATLSVINTTTNTVITTITNIAPDASPSSVSVNPTDGRIFIVNGNGKIKAINPATNTIEATIDLGNVNTLAYGDFIKSGKLGCSSTPATFTITVNPRLTPTVAIAVTSGSQNMCEGAVSSVTFTATPTYGGTTPQYQWKKNGNDVGMNSNTYTDAALAQGDIITCVLTSNADYLTTPTATSNSITIAVTPIPSINTVSNQTVCVGTATTAVAFSGTGATSYTWTNNNTAIGLAASGTGNISAFTATNSTTSAITATITVTPKAGAANCAGTPTTFTITVNPNPTVYAITGGGTSCDGSGVAVGLSNSELGVNYQLKRGGVNTGSPVAGTGSAISFGNQTTTGIYTATAVNATTNCVINMTGSANVENNATTLTPSVAITANPSGAIYTITSVTFTATPTTGGTTPQYQWQKNGANVGSNSPTYTNNSWTNGDVVTCILTSNHPCAAPTTATSNSITISATVPPAGAALNFDGADDYVNCGNATNLQIPTGTIEGWIKTSGAGSGYRGIIVKQLAYSLFLVDNVLGLYNWGGGAAVTTNVNLADNQWHHVALSFQNGVTNGSVIYIDGTARTTFTLNISNQSVGLAIGAGQPGVSQNFNGTIDEVRVWNTVRTASEIANSRSCELMGNETGLVSYYKFNQGVAELTNTGVTTLTDATTNANNGTLSNFALTGATSNWVSSSNSIGAPVTPSVSIAASPSGAITAGTSVTFTATPTNGGAAPTYVWKKGGVAISGEVSATYTSSTLANGDIITCEMTSNAACATTALATSTGITMSVTAASTYTWTGETSTDWATATNWNPNGIPGSTDNVIIPTTANKPILPANQTIANLSLTGTNKIMLGNSTLCVNAITGGSNLSYVVTDGTGGLIIKALRTNTVTTFAIGASETSYDPVAIKPTNSVDFTVKVKATANAAGFSGTIANFSKVVPRQWDVTPTGTAGSTLLAVLTSVTYVPTTPKMGHYTGTDWEELSAQYSAGSNAWLATTNSFSPFGVGDAGGFVAVLSVEWLSFTGYNKSGVNVLNWATANEVNNKGFQVERLNAQGNVWDILGFVNAKGKGSSYDFTDNTPLSTSYYRLRQIDNDGKETYSKVISVSSKGSDKLKVYPNPVSDLLIVETEMKDDYQILNLLGQQVLTGKTLPSGAKGLDVSALPQGTYFLKIGAEQVKFMKQ